MSTVHTTRQVSTNTLAQLQGIDSCTVSNAIERLGVRLRNEGFIDSAVRCLTPELTPMVGYAVPGRLRTSVAPTTGRLYYENMDWWDYVATIPAPRVIVLQDVDPRRGWGALFGEVHAQIARALHCDGYVTDGTVRDLPGIMRLGFHLFGSGIAVSHAYAHVVDFGTPVEVGGLRVNPGDLLHGDLHGVVSVPFEIAEEIPTVAARLLESEREIIELCKSPRFSLEELRGHIEQARHE